MLLSWVAALITVGLGCLGLFFPDKAGQFTSLPAQSLLAKSETRATYGGFFLGLGVSAFVFNSSVVFNALGIAWLAAALGRLLSIFVDRSYESKNWGGVVFEGLIGVLFLSHMMF